MNITMADAAEHLKTAERVLVIGCSGSGKSTLARKLADRLGLPYVSMDREIFWLPGWQSRPRAEALARLEAVVADERWIIDGTSPGTLPLRLPRTHLVLWLRPPRYMSLYGVISRWLRYRGRSRPEMADDCPEKIDREFLTYVWNFEKTESPELEENLAAFGPGVPVCVLKSRRENDRLLARLAAVH
ncbi:P-loop NTPase family protein [Shinella zoogloeoides]|uniref:AAA family ATPase n=1 Tax=Shinella zoogloeoides TaxID=352475 RepID=A0A6N8T649_SHIZO|nr:AAA family ATPase [Shinella zoogloeoides]MXN98686.1 AAA family ATPase [Shinella zoogloeoides]UEX83139.1 AAA family ATPase [Shinella zoogloeoides]